MVSRDIWSHGVGTSVRDLLQSCCSTLLLSGDNSQPTYFSSPWISNFVLYQNPFREWSGLFPDLADQVEIRFTDYLRTLASRRPVRLIIVDNPTTKSFLKSSAIIENGNIQCRFAPDTYHEKGILADEFYIEGSMNLTHSGVFLRDEKVVFHPQVGNERKIHLAYLQFNRLWDTLRVEPC